MKIFLIGFMGSGKSTIGKYVAKNAGLTFLDLDQLIEASEGKTIDEIFSEKGENYFREAEKKILNEVIDNEGDFIVSCGGGTPCFFNNMDKMNQAGITLYLDLGSARLTDRIRNSKSERPLLKNVNGDLQVHIHRMLMERSEFYSQARIIIPEEESNKKGVLKVVEPLLKKV